jgi:beta-lactamase class D
MEMEKNSNYTFSYKTGWGFLENGNALGWVIGWVVENQHPYFFALNVDGDRGVNMPVVRMYILKGILKQLGFLQGKR